MTLPARQSTGRRSMVGDEALYDRLGVGYTATRRTDPRIAERIWAALGDAQSVLNVGAGAGSYEPPDRKVVAVEPSAGMLAQRPRDAAPAVQAEAEALPFDDDAFGAVLAVISDHHWRDRARGLAEMRRVARRRVVVFNADPAEAERFWLTRDYLPGFLLLIPEPYRRPGAWAEELLRRAGAAGHRPGDRRMTASSQGPTRSRGPRPRLSSCRRGPRRGLNHSSRRGRGDAFPRLSDPRR